MVTNILLIFQVHSSFRNFSLRGVKGLKGDLVWQPMAHVYCTS